MNGVGLGSLGATTLYGEYGQYNDQFKRALVGCAAPSMVPSGPTSIHFCNTVSFTNNSASFTSPVDVFVTGSEVQRWGLGVVQEIDAAAMHVYARWQHQEIDLDLIGHHRNRCCTTMAASASSARST